MMTLKEYLSQAYWLDQQINSKIEYSDMLRELATRATSRYTKELKVKGNNESIMENAAVKLLDLQKEIDADIDRLVDLKHEINILIGQVDNIKYRLLLEYRYLHNKTWEQIAQTMCYDLRWVHRLHGRALAALSTVYTSFMKSTSHISPL